MQIPLDHLSYLAQYNSYTIIVYLTNIYYDIPLNEACRCVVVYSSTDEQFTGHLIFGKERLFRLNFETDSIITVNSSSLSDSVRKIESSAKKLGQQLLGIDLSIGTENK